MTISSDDFLKIDIRVGTVRNVQSNAQARKPAYRLEIDFGLPLGLLTSSAQLSELYAPDDLVGRQVVAVVNFAPRQVAKVLSQVLVLGFPDAAGRVVLVGPERPVPDGGRLF